VAGPSAIVEAFNPNTIGGTALALSLFGIENRWGKLPYTIYPYDVMQAFDMKDHSMSTAPGRTHRYFTGKPVYPFGYGLSLTSFEMSCYPTTGKKKLNYQCVVINAGNIIGDEVIQVYHTAGDDVRSKAKHPVPLQSLVGFERIRVEAGDVDIISFDFDLSVFELVNEKGDKIVYPGTHMLRFTNGVLEPLEFCHMITKEATGNLRASLS
jgi:beta-glucosidase